MQILYDRTGLYVLREKKSRPKREGKIKKKIDPINVFLLVMLIVVLMLFLIPKIKELLGG